MRVLSDAGKVEHIPVQNDQLASSIVKFVLHNVLANTKIMTNKKYAYGTVK